MDVRDRRVGRRLRVHEAGRVDMADAGDHQQPADDLRAAARRAAARLAPARDLVHAQGADAIHNHVAAEVRPFAYFFSLF